MIGVPTGSFFSGYYYSQNELNSYSAQIKKLINEKNEMQEQIDEVIDQNELLEAKAQEVTLELEQAFISDDHRALSNLIKKKLEKKHSFLNLQSHIELASQQKECFYAYPKRFRVLTDFSAKTDLRVNFLGEHMTVFGSGTSARDQSNRVLAWYDPQKPIEAEIHWFGMEEPVVLTKRLPFKHTVDIDDRSYEFDFFPASIKGFVKVKLKVCEL